MEGRLLAWFYVCKYRTGSKKVLQTEFRFWSFRRRFLVCNGGGGCRVFRPKGLSCNPNGILLEGKEALFALQNDYYCNANEALLKC